MNDDNVIHFRALPDDDDPVQQAFAEGQRWWAEHGTPELADALRFLDGKSSVWRIEFARGVLDAMGAT